MIPQAKPSPVAQARKIRQRARINIAGIDEGDDAERAKADARLKREFGKAATAIGIIGGIARADLLEPITAH